jgi:hypothetical protein
MCADSQLTVGPAKLDGMKIGVFHPDWGTVMMACAGDVDYAVGAFQRALSETRKCRPANALTVLGESLETYYRRHIFARPKHLDPCSYELVLAVKVRDVPQVRLYKTFETAIDETTTFDCQGIGADCARPMIALLYREDASEHYTVAMAAHVLHYIKKSVDGCGGRSVFLVLRDDGISEDLTSTPVVMLTEETSNYFVFDATKFILECSIGTDEEFRQRLSVLNSKALEYRSWWTAASTAKAQANLQAPTHDPSTLPPSPG